MAPGPYIGGLGLSAALNRLLKVLMKSRHSCKWVANKYFLLGIGPFLLTNVNLLGYSTNSNHNITARALILRHSLPAFLNFIKK
jgi:hypothetical protein